jgi:hypothetical protein
VLSSVLSRSDLFLRFKPQVRIPEQNPRSESQIRPDDLRSCTVRKFANSNCRPSQVPALPRLGARRKCCFCTAMARLCISRCRPASFISANPGPALRLRPLAFFFGAPAPGIASHGHTPRGPRTAFQQRSTRRVPHPPIPSQRRFSPQTKSSARVPAWRFSAPGV